jgi:hypothetical protein
MQLAECYPDVAVVERTLNTKKQRMLLEIKFDPGSNTIKKDFVANRIR